MAITTTSPAAARLLETAVNGGRLSTDDALTLMEEASLDDLSAAAVSVKRRISGDDVYYNRNFHIEPTNICRYNCRFCSYRRSPSEPGGWTMSLGQIEEQVKRYADSGITEVHLVGGVHPAATLEDYLEIVRTVRRLMPEASIKAFSAIEHIYVFDKAGVSFDEGLRRFMDAGMNTLTGGGAEIFAPDVRNKISRQAVRRAMARTSRGGTPIGNKDQRHHALRAHRVARRPHRPYTGIARPARPYRRIQRFHTAKVSLCGQQYVASGRVSHERRQHGWCGTTGTHPGKPESHDKEGRIHPGRERYFL